MDELQVERVNYKWNGRIASGKGDLQLESLIYKGEKGGLHVERVNYLCK